MTEGLLQARPQPPGKDQPYFRTSTGQFGTGGVLANFAHQMEKLFNGVESADELIQPIQVMFGAGHG